MAPLTMTLMVSWSRLYSTAHATLSLLLSRTEHRCTHMHQPAPAQCEAVSQPLCKLSLKRGGLGQWVSPHKTFVCVSLAFQVLWFFNILGLAATKACGVSWWDGLSEKGQPCPPVDRTTSPLAVALPWLWPMFPGHLFRCTGSHWRLTSMWIFYPGLR